MENKILINFIDIFREYLITSRDNLVFVYMEKISNNPFVFPYVQGDNLKSIYLRFKH